MQCDADLLTCALRRNLLELLNSQYGIPVPHSPLSDEQAIALLRSIVFHWDAIPWTAQFVYRVQCLWCGNGWTAPVELLPGNQIAPADVLDSDEEYDQAQGTDVSTDGEEEYEMDFFSTVY
jgi:hypothetical protein